MTARVRVLETAHPQPLPARSASWLAAAVQTARPRQWPKNLLVFAAPLAGASLGRDEGLGYALGTAAAFVAASVAVYFVNDVIDAERDRQHPVKRLRAVASGRLPVSYALALAAVTGTAAVSFGFWFSAPRIAVVIGAYLTASLLYALKLKHVAVLEMVLVTSGFVLRALAGAVATSVVPSVWFLLVCSLGALMVTISKRYAELSAMGPDVVTHRPVMRWYTRPGLRMAGRFAAAAMIVAYALWAAGQHGAWTRAWHAASVIPLAAALLRFSWLTGRAGNRPVEDLIARDPVMVAAELGWLVMFTVGLW